MSAGPIDLTGLRVALVATDGFEDVELFGPRQALLDAGARVEVVAPRKGRIQGYATLEKARAIDVDRPIAHLHVDDFDALLLPGGTVSGDTLRGDAAVLAFVRGFFDAGKPVAALCHAPWLLIDAGVARSRRLTSYPTIRTDLENAGATWVDEEAVMDGLLLTSRGPDDLPAFKRAMLDLFGRGLARLHQQG